MEQAVIVHLKLSDDEFGSDDDQEELDSLQEEIEDLLDENPEIGEFDGNEFGEGECVLYLYAPDADKLFGKILPCLKASRFAKTGYAIIRYGDAGDSKAKQVKVKLK